MYVCDRCGARFHSKRAASLELCPRCLLRDDAASPLHYRPDDRRQREQQPPSPPDGEKPGERE